MGARNKGVLGLIILNFCFAGTESKAFDFTETFASSSRWDTSNSTLVLNKSLERVHSSARVVGWTDPNIGAGNTSFSFGDGRDGDFIVSRYSEFGTVSGSTITINTDVKSELQVTNFILAAGYTLRGVGSQPLIIRSQKDVQISGIIDCAGEAGVDATTTAAGRGGVGRCGGGSGGDGSNTLNVQASNGTSGGTGVSGGTGANTNAGVSGYIGGGGGGYSLAAAPYISVDGTGGATRGTHIPDDSFQTIGGGSGGGGGGAGTTSKGAGGGAGGGVVLIYAVRDVLVDATGEIRADGGNGGSALAGNGGGGGGGAGGSILAFAGHIMDFYGAGAPYRITAQKGATPSYATTAGDGGIGRTWLVDADDAGAEGFPNGGIDDPQSLQTAIGKVQFVTTPQTLTSVVIDLGNTKPTPLTLSLDSSLPSSSTAVVEARGSDDSSTFTSWIPSTSIASLDGYRYLQFKITLTNNSTYNYSYVDTLNMSYNGMQQNQFDMVGACGRIGNTPAHLGLFIFLILFVYFRLRFYHSKPNTN